MLSEEALATADESGNRSEYIEQLIMGTQERIFEVVPLKQLTEVLGTLLEDMPKPQITAAPLENKNPENKIVSSPTARNILAEIKELEAERNEIFSQDPLDFKEINENIQNLWKEYHAAKEVSDQ